MKLEKAGDVFAETFARWGIEIEPDALRRGRGQVNESGGNISFVTGSENGQDYLEYYATHRMTDDRHVRIWASGKTEVLQRSSRRTCSTPKHRETRSGHARSTSSTTGAWQQSSRRKGSIRSAT